MPEVQWDYNGATFETRPLEVQDGLRIDYLQSILADPAETESYYFANMYAEFVVGTRIVSGDPGFTIPVSKAPAVELHEGMAAWMKQGIRLLNRWKAQKTRASRVAKPEEQPAPLSGGGTPTGASVAPPSSADLTTDSEASPEPTLG